MKHLVIPDAHVKPGVNNNRFEWLANWALAERPDVIIDMGDWADMPSLSSYDKGKKSFEGRRYDKDCKAARDARDRFNSVFLAHNLANPKDLYEPRKVALGGNHCEGRIKRVIEDEPWLDGKIHWRDLGAEEFGWQYVPYHKSIGISGIQYSHFFPSGVMNRPIGGVNPASMLLSKLFVSVTVGHNHTRDFSERTRADGRKICGLMSGCFFEHTEEYAGAAQQLWWRGAVMCNDIQDGYYDPEFKRITTLKKEYS